MYQNFNPKYRNNQLPYQVHYNPYNGSTPIGNIYPYYSSEATYYVDQNGEQLVPVQAQNGHGYILQANMPTNSQSGYMRPVQATVNSQLWTRECACPIGCQQLASYRQILLTLRWGKWFLLQLWSFQDPLGFRGSETQKTAENRPFSPFFWPKIVILSVSFYSIFQRDFINENDFLALECSNAACQTNTGNVRAVNLVHRACVQIRENFINTKISQNLSKFVKHSHFFRMNNPTFLTIFRIWNSTCSNPQKHVTHSRIQW